MKSWPDTKYLSSVRNLGRLIVHFGKSSLKLLMTKMAPNNVRSVLYNKAVVVNSHLNIVGNFTVLKDLRDHKN